MICAQPTAVGPRRGVVRVLSPAAPSAGKSLISPRALLQQNMPTAKKRTMVVDTPIVTTVAQVSPKHMYFWDL